MWKITEGMIKLVFSKGFDYGYQCGLARIKADQIELDKKVKEIVNKYFENRNE